MNLLPGTEQSPEDGWISWDIIRVYVEAVPRDVAMLNGYIQARCLQCPYGSYIVFSPTAIARLLGVHPSLLNSATVQLLWDMYNSKPLLKPDHLLSNRGLHTKKFIKQLRELLVKETK